MSLDMTHCSRDSSKGCVWRITTGETGDVVVEHQGVDRSPVGDLLNWRRIGLTGKPSVFSESHHVTPLPTFHWSQLRDRNKTQYFISLVTDNVLLGLYVSSYLATCCALGPRTLKKLQLKIHYTASPNIVSPPLTAAPPTPRSP